MTTSPAPRWPLALATSHSHRDTLRPIQSSNTRLSCHRARLAPTAIARSEAKNREAAVRIADLKAELMQLNSLIAETAAKQEQLGQSPRDSAASSVDTLPDVLYPSFDFDGEFEGTFGQSHRGIMSELLALCSADFWSSVDNCVNTPSSTYSASPPDSPQLTHDDGSSASTISTVACSSELGALGLYGFPAPPNRVSEISCHRRDSSDASGITFASTSTVPHECVTILEAKPLLLPQKSPVPVAVVEISSPSKRDRCNPSPRPSETQRRRWSNLHNPNCRAASIPYDSGAIIGAAGHGSDQVEILHKARQPRELCSPSDTLRSRSPKAHELNSSQNPRLMATASPPNAGRPPPSGNLPSQHSTTVSSDRASYSWTPPKGSSLCHELQSAKRPQHHSQKSLPEAAPESKLYLDPHAIATQHDTPASLAAVNESEHHHIHSVIQLRRPWQLRRLNRLPKLRDRPSASSAPKRSNVRHIPAWLRPLPLTSRWRRARNSTLTDLSTLSVNSAPGRNGTAPSSMPLPLPNRASLDFRFERTLMAGLESPSLSSNSSMTTLSLKTIRTIRRASRTSTVSSRVTSTSRSTDRSFFPNGEFSLQDLGKIPDRYYPRKCIKTNQTGAPPGSPQYPVVQSSLERPAAHRRLPSLTELP